MGLFGQAKDLYKLQQKAKKIKEELKSLHIEAEADGVKIVINAEQEVLEVKVAPEMLEAGQAEKLNRALKAVFNKGIKKVQEVAAEKMRTMMGDLGMNLPNGGEELPEA